jgi:folylpolyglutamate synthase/dihydropteroate synthase
MWRDAHVAPTVAAALDLARSLAGERDAICITGSFYVVGEAMERQR